MINPFLLDLLLYSLSLSVHSPAILNPLLVGHFKIPPRNAAHDSLKSLPITHFPCKTGLDVWLMFLRYRAWFFRTWKWWKFNLLKNSRKEWWRTSLLFELFSLHFYYKWKFYTIWKRKVNKPIKNHFGRIWNWYYWLISYFTHWLAMWWYLQLKWPFNHIKYHSIEPCVVYAVMVKSSNQ